VLSFSPEKLFVVGIIALIVLGPDRLPEAARSVGRFVATFRRLSSGFQDEVRDVLAEPRDAFNTALGDLRPAHVRRPVRQIINSALSPPTLSADEHAAQGPTAPAGEPRPPDEPPSLGCPDDPSLN
jgi:sec-independent protein translocase protein TatB